MWHAREPAARQAGPCPNRLEGGIDHADIAKIEIKFVQGSTYDLWLDNIAFYRQRLDGGNGD